MNRSVVWPALAVILATPVAAYGVPASPIASATAGAGNAIAGREGAGGRSSATRELLAVDPSSPTDPQPIGDAASGEDVLGSIPALVAANEAELPAPPEVDGRRLALAKEILAESYKDYTWPESRSVEMAADVRRRNPKIPPRIVDATLEVFKASLRPAVMEARVAQQLAVRLDEETLRAGLDWERSDLGRRVRTAWNLAEGPGQRADMKAYVEQHMRKGAMTDDVRARACAQIVALTDLADGMVSMFGSMAGAFIVGAAVAEGKPLDMMSLGKALGDVRGVLRMVTREGAVISCLFAFREVEDGELDRWLDFLRSDAGGRYARGKTAAEADVFNERGGIMFRTMLQLAPRLRPSGTA